MTTEKVPRNLDPAEDPLLDWHSDARMIMDAYANEVAYRQIAGTQLDLLRRAADLGAAIPASDVMSFFEKHRRLCAAAGSPGAAFTAESFVGFLTARVLLKPDSDGFLITSVGRDFIRFIDDHGFPPKGL
jgi:hypothetical protein